MQRWSDHLITGIILGLLAPVFAFWLYNRMNHPELSMPDLFSAFKGKNVHTHVISLSVIANLIVFFISLWTQHEKTARGILGMTIVYAILVFILKFI